MVKIAIVVNGEQVYPVFTERGKYFIDLGVKEGMVGPLSFRSDTEAIACLRRGIASGIRTF